jgi:hypothetical protein
MYVAGWGTARYRSQADFRRGGRAGPWGMEGELDGGDEAADG